MKRVYIRILVFYIGGTAIIGLLVPSNDSRLNLKDQDAAASPFVLAISHAGIRVLPSVSYSHLYVHITFFIHPRTFADCQRCDIDVRMVCCIQ
jgi:amino acid permease